MSKHGKRLSATAQLQASNPWPTLRRGQLRKHGGEVGPDAQKANQAEWEESVGIRHSDGANARKAQQAINKQRRDIARHLSLTAATETEK